jgi:putative FmdB family regulatory protein
MPIYEYQCTECGAEKEVLQKLSDAPLTDCPTCGKSALRKKISAAAFRLKGSGWYETDFKSGNKKNIAGDSGGGDSGSNSAKAAGGDGAGASSKSGDKTASKPAGKADKSSGSSAA